MRRTKKSKLRGRTAIPVIGHIQTLMARPVLFYGGLCVGLLLLSLLHVQKGDGVRTQMWSVFSPVVSTVSRPFVAVSSFLGNITSYQKLQADYQLLKDENETLMAWYHTAQLLQAENKSLKSLLNVQSIPVQSFMTAHVLSDFSSPYVQSVLLDVGEKDGIVIGQAIIADKGLLGRVVDVETSIARVLLVTDINSRIPVTVEGTSQKGVLAGRNLNAPKLEYVPEGVALEVGMPIVTSGDGGMFPAGLPVGKISSIGDNNSIYVELLGDYNSVDYVRVLERVEEK
ncbi:MAG: rod shape-determining protein MreC [Bdellovibrionales bacterium]